MTTRARPLCLPLAASVTVASLLIHSGGVAGARTVTPAVQTGREIYRQYCGQCHALKVALAAGFGQGGRLGTYGGPSFNQLRVPYAMSIQAVTEPTGGHERVKKKINQLQLVTVARWVATVTRNHPVPAFPTDG
jgi:mono/diheme cytochrome c family protein